MLYLKEKYLCSLSGSYNKVFYNRSHFCHYVSNQTLNRHPKVLPFSSFPPRPSYSEFPSAYRKGKKKHPRKKSDTSNLKGCRCLSLMSAWWVLCCMWMYHFRAVSSERTILGFLGMSEKQYCLHLAHMVVGL